MKRIYLKLLLLFLTTITGQAVLAGAQTPFNELILRTIKEIPEGGGYDNKAAALDLLKDAIVLKQNNLQVAADKARPIFCSAATYLVFLKTLSRLQQDKKIKLTAETQKELLVLGAKEQPDGAGIWGRWNANGPGTARLFTELNLGRNFGWDKLSEAVPGDFMKIFWTDEIGAKEHGHSVVFMGTKKAAESGTEICFWSSNLASKNQPAGLGTKCVSEKRIHRALFSRLEFPENLNQAPKMMGLKTKNYVDTYLHGLLERSSSAEEMNAYLKR